MRLSVTHVANHMAKLLLQTCLTTSFTSPLEHLSIQVASPYTGLIPDLIMIFIHTATYSLHVTGNTVNAEILVIHLIWRFGDEQLNRQI